MRVEFIMKNKKKLCKHVHCLGIGGIGVSALAEMFIKKGYRVTGSDLFPNNNTERLESLGADIIYHHHGDVIKKADYAIYSSAIESTNPEFQAALSANIPLLKRGEVLAQVMEDYISIAVSGTHGKTTTSALLSDTFMKAELDPSFMVGGILKSINTPARVGNGHYFIAEVDESDASLLFMNPNYLIITNIEPDHLITYQGDFGELKKTYLDLISQIKSDGSVIICIDDSTIRTMIKEIQGALPNNTKLITYGSSDDADYSYRHYLQKGMQGNFVVSRPEKTDLTITLSLPGQHNALNSLSLIAVADSLKISDEKIKNALLTFSGVGRRFDICGELLLDRGSALIIDDYGHHPNEISVTIKAVRSAWPNKRLVLAFQPHRYTRTQDLMNEFTDVLQQADVMVLTNVYSAGEAPIPGSDSESLYKRIQKLSSSKNNFFMPTLEELFQQLPEILKPDDIVLFQGAGDINTVSKRLISKKND